MNVEILKKEKNKRIEAIEWSKSVKEKNIFKLSLCELMERIENFSSKKDYEEFLKYKVNKKDAKKRAKEATQGVIESIKWLEDMDIVVVVLDATENPYNQVNITIIGNLVARKIPVLIVANKSDLKKADVKRVEAAFPEYDTIGISAKYGDNLEEFYESIFKLSKKV